MGERGAQGQDWLPSERWRVDSRLCPGEAEAEKQSWLRSFRSEDGRVLGKRSQAELQPEGYPRLPKADAGRDYIKETFVNLYCFCVGYIFAAFLPIVKAILYISDYFSILSSSDSSSPSFITSRGSNTSPRSPTRLLSPYTGAGRSRISWQCRLKWLYTCSLSCYQCFPRFWSW